MNISSNASSEYSHNSPRYSRNFVKILGIRGLIFAIWSSSVFARLCNSLEGLAKCLDYKVDITYNYLCYFGQKILSKFLHAYKCYIATR